ncbi:hypothetical protein [Novipirellula caenicola]|uniref:GerMN domain-containing protein n=1 Tax=Novipirellula caenicola TaxID=1536901 RepID=A0ABP9VRX1_9BACT
MNRLLLPLVLLLAFSDFVCPAAESAPVDPVWILFERSSANKEAVPRYFVTVSSGTSFDLTSQIVGALPENGLGGVKVTPVDKFDLVFSGNLILVLKIEGDSADLAPDDRFPYSVTKSLADALKSSGVKRINVRAVEDLLQPLATFDRPDEPFHDPHERRFAFRQSGVIETPNDRREKTEQQ